MASVAIVGRGQLGNAVAEVLRAGGRHEVRGPFGRVECGEGTSSGADVVVIATTTRFADISGHVEAAVIAGSNVLVTAEEAADPSIVDPILSARLDDLARQRGVSICGAGVNPGLIFDALVLTLLGTTDALVDIVVRRTVDISGFGPAVLRRIGVGLDTVEFEAGVAGGSVLGHAGFPQSMSVVAKAVGIRIDHVDRRLTPLISTEDVILANGVRIAAGQAVGVDQEYVGVAEGRPWYTASFFGHCVLPSTGNSATDVIEFWRDGEIERSFVATPGIGAQHGSRNMVVNSIDRILKARSGWISVADLPPATPQRN